MARSIGRYEVLAELGRGGFGHVYRCLDPTLGTQVAIKTLTAESDPGMLVRFRNEAATSRRLTHPNIVTIYDFGDQDGVPYIVMELLEGQDLHRVIETRMPLSLLDKIEILSQIAAGLGHAHKHGIVHRDVKPANVMLLKDRTAKIMDFGIALITQATGSRLTPRGAMIGTFRYMAPEQFRGSEPDARCDIFAYGLMSYELLSGVHPFYAPEAAALMYNTLNVEPVPIGELAPECAGALQVVVARLLLKDPDLRYQSLDDVMLDLEPVLLQLREQKAEDLLQEARLAKSQGELERARALTREVLGLAPGHRAAREFREELQIELRKRAIRPRLDELVKQGRQAMAAGNPGEAAQRFESAIHLDPDDTEIRDLLREAREAAERLRESERIASEAFDAFQAGDHARALQLARQALDLAPGLVAARRLIRRAEQALAEEQRKKDLSEKLARARRLFEIRSWDAALELLAEVERASPGTSEAQSLAEKVRAGHKKEQAERELAAGLASAREQFQSGDLGGALKRLVELTGRFRESAEAASMLSVVQLEIEERERREFVPARIAEAKTLAARQEFDAALRVFDRALARYPTDPELQRERQSTLLAMREYSRRAAADIAMAQAMELRAGGQFAEALQTLEACLGAYGANPALKELCDSIIQEQQAARHAAELHEFVRRANDLIAKAQWETVTILFQNSPEHLREHPEVTRLMHAADRQKREQEKKQEALAALAGETQRLCEGGNFDGALQAFASYEAKYGNDSRAAQVRDRILDGQYQAEVAGLLKKTNALMASNPAQATALLNAASQRVREHPKIRDAEAALRAAAIADHSARARQNISEGRFAEAANILAAAIKSFPGDAGLIALRTDLIAAQKEQERAAWRRQIAARVRDLLNTHRYQEAWGVLKEALSSDGASTELLELRKEVEDSERRWRTQQESARAAEEARQREQIRQSAVARIRTLLSTQRFSEAARAAEEALVIYSGDPELVNLRGEISELHRRWTAEDADRQIRHKLSAARALIPTHPAQAVSQLEALARSNPGRTDIEPALVEAREVVAAEQRRQRVVAEAERLGQKGKFDEALERLQSLGPSPEVENARQRMLALQAEAARRLEVEKQAAFKEIERLRDRGQMAQANKRLRAAIKHFGNDPIFQDALGPSAAPAPQPRPEAAPLRPRVLWIIAAVLGLVIVSGAVWFLTRRPIPPALQSLEIRTDPAGATIRVGSQACISPNCDLKLAPGSYDLSATRNGYQPVQRSVVIEAGKRPEAVTLLLTPVPVPPPPLERAGELRLRAGLPEARVLIDDVAFGRTDAAGNFSTKLKAASHTIGIEKIGYDSPPPKQIIVGDNKTTEVAMTLRAHNGRLELQGAPAGVEVRVNGALLGRTIGGTLSTPVPAGTQTLHVTEGTESRDIVRTFEPDRSLALDWRSVGIASKATPSAPKIDPAEQSWETVRASTDPGPVEGFLRKYPNSPHLGEARSLLDSIAWSRVNQNDAQSLRDYSVRFPGGQHAREASSQIADLLWKGVDQKDEQAVRLFVQQNPNNSHSEQAQAILDQLRTQKQKQLPPPPAAPPAVSSPATPAVVPTAPPMETADLSAIRNLLSDFGEACSHMDVKSALTFWPTLPKDLREGLQFAKSRGDSYRCSLEPTSAPIIHLDTATVAVRRTFAYEKRGQQQAQTSTGDAIIRLRKTEGRWIIVGI